MSITVREVRWQMGNLEFSKQGCKVMLKVKASVSSRSSNNQGSFLMQKWVISKWVSDK